MFESLYNDLREAIRNGNAVTRIILINVGVFVLLNLINVFTFHAGGGPSSFYSGLMEQLSLPSAPMTFLKKFWTIITYMFTQVGFRHILWNMLLFYWFGRILGDFLGDKRIIPIYLLAGIFGGMIFMITDIVLPSGTGGMAVAIGASASVMGVMVAAATLSPDYTMHLLFLGPVKIKYIVLVMFFLDLIGTIGSNSGGHFAHIGGAVFGILYINMLRQGTDLTTGLQVLFSGQAFASAPKPAPRKTKLKVVHNQSNPQQESNTDASERLDRILEKIKIKGYDNLSEDEKSYLNEASKK